MKRCNSFIEISRADLLEKIWSQPLKSVARQLGINALGLKRACSLYDIPFPKSSDIEKIKYSKNATKPSLPPLAPAGEILRFGRGILLIDHEILKNAQTLRKERNTQVAMDSKLARAQKRERNIKDRIIRESKNIEEQKEDFYKNRQKYEKIIRKDMESINLLSSGYNTKEISLRFGISIGGVNARRLAILRRGKSAGVPFNVLCKILYARSRESRGAYYRNLYSGPAITIDRAYALCQWEEAADAVQEAERSHQPLDPFFDLRPFSGMSNKKRK